MAKKLKFEYLNRELHFKPFDGNKEMHVFTDCYGDTTSVWLKHEDVNKLITHLTIQLQSIGVEVDILKK